MNIRFVIIAVFLLSASLLWSQTSEDVELSTKTGSLQGTLSLPGSEGQFPVVLIIAGSGPTDRNGNNPVMKNNSLQLLADGLMETLISFIRS